MKLLIIMTALCTFLGSGSFYSIQFENINGRTVLTDSMQGKKVVIAVVDAQSPNLTQLRFLDSLKRNTTNLEVIGVLTEDFGKKAKLKDVRDSTENLNIILTKPLKVKKNKGIQHPLFNWLTSDKENQHFDVDVLSEEQLFVISGKGTLYAVLIKETPKEVVNKVLTQPFAQ